MNFQEQAAIRTRILNMCGLALAVPAFTHVLPSYNKRPDEFASSREYNDYLEEAESIGAPPTSLPAAPALTLCPPVFNLCNRIDVAATEATVAAYVAAHGENISANRVRQAEERRLASVDTAAPPPPDLARVPLLSLSAWLTAPPAGCCTCSRRASSSDSGSTGDANCAATAPDSRSAARPGQG